MVKFGLTPSAAAPAENLVFFGHHKCASRFFRKQVFETIAKAQGYEVVTYNIQYPPYHFSSLPDLDLDMVDFARLNGAKPVVVNLLNSSPEVLARVEDTNSHFRGLHVLRDPRQVLVSAYFHHRGSHPVSSPAGFIWDTLARDQPILRSLPQEDGLLHEMDNITRGVIGHMEAWPGHPRVIEARVEDINIDRSDFMRRLSDHLGIDLDSIPPIDWTATYSDSGGGDWRRYFTPRIKTRFKDLFGETLIKLGYARDHDW